MPLPKPCDNCGKRFQPKTQHTKLCDMCRQLVRNVNFINMISHRLGRPKIKIVKS